MTESVNQTVTKVFVERARLTGSVNCMDRTNLLAPVLTNSQKRCVKESYHMDIV